MISFVEGVDMATAYRLLLDRARSEGATLLSVASESVGAQYVQRDEQPVRLSLALLVSNPRPQSDLTSISGLPGAVVSVARHDRLALDAPTPGGPPASLGRPLRLGLVAAADLVDAGLRAVLEPLAGRVHVDTRAELLGDADLVLVGPLVDDGTHVVIPPQVRRSRLVAFGWDDAPRRWRQAQILGVDAYVSLTLDAPSLVSALESIRVGRPVPRPRVGALPIADDLSEREAQVLTLICRGLPNAEIADQLFLSINSVKTYVRTAYRKMGVTTRSQAVVWGVDRGY